MDLVDVVVDLMIHVNSECILDKTVTVFLLHIPNVVSLSSS